MSNRAKLLKAAEKKKSGATQTPEEIRYLVARLERKRAREARRFEAAPEFSEERARIGAKIQAIDEKMDRHLSMLGRMTVTSETDRILGSFLVGKVNRRLATQVDEEVGIGNLQRTTRLLTSLKKAGKLDCEVTSVMEGDRRVRRRWWWRLR